MRVCVQINGEWAFKEDLAVGDIYPFASSEISLDVGRVICAPPPPSAPSLLAEAFCLKVSWEIAGEAQGYPNVLGFAVCIRDGYTWRPVGLAEGHYFLTQDCSQPGGIVKGTQRSVVVQGPEVRSQKSAFRCSRFTICLFLIKLKEKIGLNTNIAFSLSLIVLHFKRCIGST